MTGALKTTRLLGTALLVGSLAACVAAEPETPQDMSAEAAAAIRQADMAFAAAASAGDVEGVMAATAGDAMIFPPGQPMVSGTDAIRALWMEMTAMPGFAISWQADGTAAASSGDLGYSWGTAQITMDGPDGTPMTSQEKYVTVWRKDAAGAWKVVADIFNSNTPPPGAGG